MSVVQQTPNKFIQRVLLLSTPTALMFLLLVCMGEILPSVAIMGFAVVVVLIIVLTLPFFEKLSQVYDTLISMDGDDDDDEIKNSDNKEETSIDETARIVSAVNRMRSVWLAKTEKLTQQTISDAAVLDSLPDPLIMVDINGIICGANLAARDILGADVRDRTFTSVLENNNMGVNTKYLEEITLALKDVLNGGFRKKQLDLFVNDKYYSVKIEQLPAPASGGALAIVSLFDITARRIFEQMQTDFIANASHELKTPLFILSGFVETLQTTAHDDVESRDKFLGIMKTQSDRMKSLIENLLSLSKLTIKESEALTDQVDIVSILKDVKEELDAKAERFGSKIVVKSAIPSASICGDEAELNMVFRNLTDNGLKYGQRGGTITLTCSNSENGFVVDCHNTGGVINPDAIPRLFDRFYRAPDSQTKANGTGLGLSIVKQIVKHHGGNISVDSTAEHGTTFSVVLPYSKNS
ncbi:MAG: ATP-binding protein [Alphaproteobacteria bacterium]|nr:ATP-binding protein [Alphaproteobacteria bacterium]